MAGALRATLLKALAVALIAGSVTVTAPFAMLNRTEAMTAQHQARTGEFLEAARTNDVAALKAGIDRGIPVDATDQRGRTALLIATHANSIDAARLLIAAGADVNAKDDISDSPYLYAGAEGRLEILRMTVEAGADLSSVNRYGGTSLIPAAHHGHPEVVRYLLTTQIDIDHVNDLGWTALLEAVILGDGGPVYQEIVGLLVDAGADATIGDNDGVSPLQHARRLGQDEIVRILDTGRIGKPEQASE